MARVFGWWGAGRMVPRGVGAVLGHLACISLSLWTGLSVIAWCTVLLALPFANCACNLGSNRGTSLHTRPTSVPLPLTTACPDPYVTCSALQDAGADQGAQQAGGAAHVEL